jgi:hypothetical protein
MSNRPVARKGNTPAAPEFSRPALAPGLLGAIALMVGLALLDVDAFTIVRFVVSILALIVCVFAVQGKAWWWLIGLAPIAVLWNPIFVIELHGQGWVSLQFVAALIFIASGIFIKVPTKA